MRVALGSKSSGLEIQVQKALDTDRPETQKNIPYLGDWNLFEPTVRVLGRPVK